MSLTVIITSLDLSQKLVVLIVTNFSLYEATDCVHVNGTNSANTSKMHYCGFEIELY
jgi:hypothetical protein